MPNGIPGNGESGKDFRETASHVKISRIIFSPLSGASIDGLPEKFVFRELATNVLLPSIQVMVIGERLLYSR